MSSPAPDANASALAAILDRLTGARVVIVGDAMLDRFIYGEVERISPEAPIPVLRETRETAMAGGAGNVARNIAALGAVTDFVSLIGDDAAGQQLSAMLAAEAGVVPRLRVLPDHLTTVKTRYVAGHQQMLRADRERTSGVPQALQRRIVENAQNLLPDAGALVVSDYGKGVFAPDGAAGLIAFARQAGVPVVVDPKGADFTRYRGATVVTPNRKELQAASGMATGSDEEIVAAARKIVADCGIDYVLATRSADGMSLIGASEVHHLPAEAREVFDVSGAGDTVVAAIAAGLAAGVPLLDAARLANVAAGIVVAKVGTAVARRDEIADAIHAGDLLRGERKIAGLDGALDQVARWRRQGLRVGFTNGCFDLLHPGHVSLLEQARAACDRLIVGLNSDASVKRLKGPERPVQSEAARAVMLGSLAGVDLVVIFGEDTPLRLIKALKPDVLVKGADYALKDVVGGDLVQSYGGKVVLAELVPGQSTTATISRMAR
ncbi:MAG: D-glycero-beta-D-manno-heptose-7-phosphate kinase [Alphaproteobacteria bacterium]